MMTTMTMTMTTTTMMMTIAIMTTTLTLMMMVDRYILEGDTLLRCRDYNSISPDAVEAHVPIVHL